MSGFILWLSDANPSKSCWDISVGTKVGGQRINTTIHRAIPLAWLKAHLNTFQQSLQGRLYFVKPLPPPRKGVKNGLLCLCCRGQDGFSALSVASARRTHTLAPSGFTSSRLQREPPSFDTVFPKGTEPSLPQWDFTFCPRSNGQMLLGSNPKSKHTLSIFLLIFFFSSPQLHWFASASPLCALGMQKATFAFKSWWEKKWEDLHSLDDETHDSKQTYECLNKQLFDLRDDTNHKIIYCR